MNNNHIDDDAMYEDDDEVHDVDDDDDDEDVVDDDDDDDVDDVDDDDADLIEQVSDDDDEDDVMIDDNGINNNNSNRRSTSTGTTNGQSAGQSNTNKRDKKNGQQSSQQQQQQQREGQQQQQQVSQQGQGQQQQPQPQAQPNNNNRRSSRLSDTLEIDDEPALAGYERTEIIGQGAYGIVYKGRKESTNEIVAIKRIPFSDSTPEGGVPCNVIREISLLRELDHQNVVKLYDIIQAQPNGLYLVFEYVAHDLKTYMDQFQTSDDISDRVGLPLSTVRNFLRQIIAGVGCCHTYRILHRDLKPHNLLISGDGKHVKLADFGLARLSAIPNGPYTFEVVTLWYRAPELLLGANRYSTAVDVWSIGCIFAEMASGMPLFPGRSDIDQLFKIFQRRGTPTGDSWPAVLRLPHYNNEFPQWRELPITDFVTLESLGGLAGVDLILKLLQYDPDRRIACKTALQHPFFLHE